MITTLSNVSTLGKAKVIVDIVQKGNYEVRPAYAMNPSQIAIHNTGNSGRGANAEMHNRYIHNMSALPPQSTRYASWHFSVDHKSIYQHLPLNENAWHTGDGSGANSGNRTAIGIEICENSDMTDAEYRQAEENAIALAVYLMKAFNIPVSKVRPHQSFSGKYCPRVILKRDGGFGKFSNRIASAFNGKVETSVSTKPNTKVDTGSYVGKRVESIYKGSDGLNFYSKPDFDANPVGTLKEGWGFPEVLGKVNGMYKVKNSKGAIYYVTSSPVYVKLEGESKPAPKPEKEEINGIEVAGHIKIANLNNFTYIYSRNNDGSTRLGRAYKGKVFPISGSVSGWYEVIYNGKRAYIKAKYCNKA
jgi:N-acetylmuramoyl-L-alanine amidase